MSGLETVSIIRAKPGGSVPVGWQWFIYYGRKVPDGWLRMDGRRLRIKDFLELYNAIGDAYCPQRIDHDLPPGRWERVRRAFGLTPRYRHEQVPNPDYCLGYFRLPDEAGPFVMDREAA